MQRRTRTWTLGGVLLLISGLLTAVGSQVVTPPASAVVGIVVDIVWAAAVLVFAVGADAESSVVRRRPVGLVALVVVAVWSLIERAVAPLFASDVPNPSAIPLNYVLLLVPLIAALIGVVAIARAKTVPAPWNWAPSWALALTVVAWLIPQLALAAASGADAQSFVELYFALNTVAALICPVGLGVLALVLAASQRPGSTTIFRSATDDSGGHEPESRVS